MDNTAVSGGAARVVRIHAFDGPTTPRRGAAGYVPTLPQNVARTIRLHIRQTACHARSRLAYAYPRPPVRYVAGSLAEPSQQPLPDVDCPRYDSEGL